MSQPFSEKPVLQSGHDNLKSRALKGGAYIVMRQGLGMVLSLIGVLFVTRLIGPTEYGIFAACYGVLAFIGTVGTWGIDVYLIRKPGHVESHEYNLGFTLLLLISLVFVCALELSRSTIAGLIHIPEAAKVLAGFAFYVPAQLLALPGVVQLDRELRFRRVAYNELASQILNYCVAVPLAVKGAGAWAPAGGMLTQQVALLVLTYISTNFRPRLAWNTQAAREMLGYGLSYSSSIWVWQLRNLVNPVVVGRFAGATAVGNVALAIRLTEVLSFAKNATWRVAMAALAKFGDDRNRLRRSIQEGMRLQALAVGFPLAGFALVSAFILPPLFGHRWDPALRVFPFIALSYLTNSMLNLHSSVLYVLRENLRVTCFHAVHVAVFAVGAVLFVSRFGAVGYGLAETLALSTYLVIHVAVVKSVGAPNYLSPALWFSVSALALAISRGPVPLRLFGICLLLVPLCLPRERANIVGYARLLRPSRSA